MTLEQLKNEMDAAFNEMDAAYIAWDAARTAYYNKLKEEDND